MSKIAPFRMRNGCAICETLKKPAMLRIVKRLGGFMLLNRYIGIYKELAKYTSWYLSVPIPTIA